MRIESKTLVAPPAVSNEKVVESTSQEILKPSPATQPAVQYKSQPSQPPQGN